MAVKKDYNALIAELKKNIETVEINLEKARQAERKTAEKRVEIAFKAFERSNKKLTVLTQKAPIVSAKKTPAQIARLQKWKASVTEQRQTTSLLKIDLNSAKSALADLKKREKELQTIEKERAAVIKNILKARKTKSTPKTKAVQKKLVSTKIATKPTEKKPVKQKATIAKAATKTPAAPKTKITPKATSRPKPVETPIDQKEEAKETIQAPIQADLIGMNPEFASIAEPEASLEETLPVKTDSIEKENTEKESTAE